MFISDRDVQSVPGAFMNPDFLMFRALLGATGQSGSGDLAELGVLHGKSAVLIGSYLRPDETFTVVDLFEDPAGDQANAAENAGTYSGLTRASFEGHYRRLHGRLPQVVQGPSETIVDFASHGAHRFVHVDASHLYEHVSADIRAARVLLRPDGVLVLDDYRAPHTPGVAAATWEAVLNKGLKPVALSPQKFYGTWGDPEELSRTLEDAVRGTGLRPEIQHVAGHSLLRVPAPAPGFARTLLPDAALPIARKAWRAAYLRTRTR